MGRTKANLAQINIDASTAITSSSGSATTTGTAVSGAYTFTAGRKYQMVITSSNANSGGIWQFSYSVSGGGTQSGINHGRFGGATIQQVFNMANIFTATSSGSQTVTVTATLVTSGTANWDDVSILIIPLPS